MAWLPAQRPVGSVVLSLVDPDGKAATSAKISAEDEFRHMSCERRVGPEDFRDGGVLLQGLPAIRVRFLVEAPPWAMTRSAAIEVRSGDVVRATVQMQRGATVTGRVLDAVGAPVADALIALSEPEFVDFGST